MRSGLHARTPYKSKDMKYHLKLFLIYSPKGEDIDFERVVRNIVRELRNLVFAADVSNYEVRLAIREANRQFEVDIVVSHWVISARQWRYLVHGVRCEVASDRVMSVWIKWLGVHHDIDCSYVS